MKIIITEREDCHLNAKDYFNRYHCDAVFDNEFFMMILACTASSKYLKEFVEFLLDAKGTFTKDEYRYFSLFDYTVSSTDPDEEIGYRIMMSNNNRAYRDSENFSIDALRDKLNTDESLHNYGIIPLGRELLKEENDAWFDCCPIVIITERERIMHSKCLNMFIYKMINRYAHNCVLLFGSDAARDKWDSTDNNPVGCVQWYTAYARLLDNSAVCHDKDEAFNIIRERVSNFNRTPKFLIGISYAHYEPDAHYDPEATLNKWETDKEKLDRLAQKLGTIYGRDRILYDRFTRAQGLFTRGQAQQISLEAYRECKYNIILWNYWTNLSQNCRHEREDAIFPRCNEGKADYLVLQTGSWGQPNVMDLHKEYAITLTGQDDNISQIVRIIEERLMQID